MESGSIGPYTVHEKIGSGGMGEVYRAYDERLDRWVAIKSIPPSKEMSEERRTRLRREARAAAGLNHPAIAQVHDILQEADRDHIIMEYVEGRTVAELMEDGSLPIDRAVDIARQVAEGLATAHEHGVVHRDLKAENIMVSDGGRVKILDFGLAKRLEAGDGEESLTRDGVVIGTCGAMSPEQAEGREVDHRSDLFSFGTLLYCMVSGKHPFSAPSAVDTMRRVVFEMPRPANQVNHNVPINLADLIEWLLQKHPDRRPGSAREVAVALQAVSRTWSGSQSTTLPSGYQITTPIRAIRERRRRLLIAGAIAAPLLLVATIVVLWLTKPGPPRVVAVLKPRLGENADPERAPLVASAVRMAALNWIASASGLTAPDISEVDAIDGTPQEVALAVAADEVLAFDIDGCQVACRLQIRRLDANGRVQWSDEYEPSPEDLVSSAMSMAIMLGHAFPRYHQRYDLWSSRPSEEDLRAYLEAKMQIDNPQPGVTRVRIAKKLEAIRLRSPRFVDVLITEANVSRYLFESTSDISYLAIARRSISRARELAPEDPRAIETEFKVCLSAGEDDESKRVLAAFKKIDPSNPRILFCQAHLARRYGNCTESIALLARLVTIRPSWLNKLRLGQAELHCGRIDDARSSFLSGLERAPRNRHLKSNLAHLELLSGDPTKAEELYTELAGAFPAYLTLNNLGLSRLLLKQYDAAVDAYMAAHQLNKNDIETLVNIADAYQLSGKTEEAKDWYRLAIERTETVEDQDSIQVLMAKAQCYAHLENKSEAAKLSERIIRVAPENPFAYYTSALVNSVLGQHISAINNIETAAELGVSVHWFELPWFDSLKNEAGFAQVLAKYKNS